MHSPKISVVMTNFNKEDVIRETIDSVLNQTEKDFEFIIVDDGSTDNSRKIIQSYKDQRIKPLFLNENEHICKATNRGLKEAKGEYIARIDSDDVWMPDKLEKQLRFLEKRENLKVCYTKVDLINEKSEIVNEKLKDYYNLYNQRQPNRGAWLRFFFYIGNSLIQSTMMYERSLLDEVGFFNLAYIQAHDFDFCVRLAKKYDLGFVEEPLVRYRRMEGQNSQEKVEENVRFFNESMSIKKHFFDDMDDETFVYSFKESFVNSQSKTKDELECEKAFLLLRGISFGPINPILGLEKIEEMFHEEKYEKILKEKYNYTPKDFYQDNLKHQFYSAYIFDEIEKLRTENNTTLTEIVNLKKQNAYLKAHIKKMESTKSWKITKPLRETKALLGNFRGNKND